MEKKKNKKEDELGDKSRHLASEIVEPWDRRATNCHVNYLN